MIQGSSITRETREEGYQAILPFIGDISKKVYEVVSAQIGGLTAEEVDTLTGVGLNNARSRCTEHFKKGRFMVIGKRPNKKGTRNIAIYTLKPCPQK